MVTSEMHISDTQTSPVTNEGEIIDRLLPLDGAAVIELGCGKADKTRLVAQRAASVLALEVDTVQLARNMSITDLPNVSFRHGGAEAIAAADSAFDIVLMFKSLHHVPVGLMDQAFAEIRRVLKPGGYAYISEPVYAGDFNDILRLFHDEQAVREAAFAATRRAQSDGGLALVSQTFFLQPMHFDDFGQFDEQIMKVTHTDHRLSPELFEQVRARFARHMSADGAHFHMPMRVDLLRKAA